jgi:hypothetical protein
VLWSLAGPRTAKKGEFMANLELRFIRGVMFKTLILGSLFSLASLLISTWFALSTLVGVVVATANLRFVEWISNKLITVAKAGKTSPTPWSMLLIVKLFAIFALIWVLLAYFKLDAAGFSVGFSSFLPAIVWQAILAKDDDSSEPDNKA